MAVKIIKMIKIIKDYNVSHIFLIFKKNKRNIVYFVTKEVYMNHNTMRNDYLYSVLQVDCWLYIAAGSEVNFFHM